MAGALEVSDISVSFGGVAAVRNATLSLAPGEVQGLIGPNGSGKTTLVNAVSGFVHLDSGKVFVNGRDVTGMSAHGRAAAGMARAFQNPILLRSMSALEFLELGSFGADKRGFLRSALRPVWSQRQNRASERSALELLDSIGVEGVDLHQPLTTLPHGTLKLLDVARAVASKPILLLLDEPTSGLNEVEIAAVQALVQRLKGQGVAVLIVEHHVQFVHDVADSLTVLHGGRVVGHGPCAEVLAMPEVVEAYLGEKWTPASPGAARNQT